MKLTDAELRYLRHYWEECLTLVRGPAKRNTPTEPLPGYIHGKLCSLLAVLERTEKRSLEAILERIGQMPNNPVPTGEPVWPWPTIQELEHRSAQADAFLEHQRSDVPIIRENCRAENTTERSK